MTFLLFIKVDQAVILPCCYEKSPDLRNYAFLIVAIVTRIARPIPF